MAPHSWASRAAVGVTTVLALLQLFWGGVRAEDGRTIGIAAFLGAVTLLAAAVLARANAFETRLGVVIVCCAQIGLMLLALFWGLPGSEPHPVDQQAVIALVASGAVLALLAVDRRLRARSAEPDPAPPYAL